MEAVAQQEPRIVDTVVFLEFFRELPDGRQSAKVKYPLDEVLLLCLLAVIAGAETITDIARFGDMKLELLRRLRPFREGTPSHDHLGDILATLDPEAFQSCFVAWAAALVGVPEGVIAVDGKTVRRSKSKTDLPIHMVSAFAARQRLVLGQVKVAEKANEIVAIPKLLDMLDIEGAVVTIDAMGCQRAIAQKIMNKKADYILALKGNQGTLRDDVRHDWPGLNAVVMVESTREIGDKIERETRFYITSLVLLASVIGPYVRDHWAVENSLHWILDCVFRDDECRLRTDHAPANFTTIKHMALNLIRRAPGKDSMRLKRKVAAWDDAFLASVITG
jgi:predicted transposase YbfD/YdcC